MKSELSLLQNRSQQQLKILALDDDPVVIKVLEEIFSHISHTYLFRFSKTVTGFHKILSVFTPDIILLDVNLPDGNGINICSTVRKDLPKEKVTILMMTSEASEKTVKSAYDAGADDYIRKPFYPFEMEAKIELLHENIVARKKLNKLYNEVKLYNKKLYQLTSAINENIGEISRSELLTSLEDVTKLIGGDFCEIVLSNKPENRSYRINSSQSDIFIDFETLKRRVQKITQADFEHTSLTIHNKNVNIHTYIYKILLNRQQSGFVVLQSIKPLHKEALNMLKLYLDFMNMKGADIDIKNQLKKEIEKDRKEVAKVRTIQVSLLPNFKDFPGYDIASTFIPMDEISGDFYDGFYLQDDVYQFIVCDVCGHGMASSYIGSAVRSIIRTISLSCNEPSAITRKLNDVLTQTIGDTAYFATMFLWQINFTKSEMSYVSAGHPDALLFHYNENKISKLSPTGPLIGLFPDCNYEAKTISFHDFDKLFVYTDGLIESPHPETGVLYGTEKLVDEFSQCASTEHPIDAIHSILGSVYTYTDYSAVEDDITIICMEKTKSTK